MMAMNILHVFLLNYTINDVTDNIHESDYIYKNSKYKSAVKKIVDFNECNVYCAPNIKLVVDVYYRALK